MYAVFLPLGAFKPCGYTVCRKDKKQINGKIQIIRVDHFEISSQNMGGN